MSDVPATGWEAIDRLQRRSLGVGVVAAAGCVVGAVLDPGQFFRAYLAAYQFVLGLGLGALVVLMVYHLTGGAWGFLVRRVLEAATRTLPLLAVFFLPFIFGLSELFVWARPEEVAASRDLQHKQVYLNVPFFWVRVVLYFILWGGFTLLLNRWSRRQDRAEQPGLPERMARVSALGLVVYGVTITFASVDWLMSLQPVYHSTIFGPLFASRQLLSSFAFTLLVLAWLVYRPPLAEYFSVQALNDLGNLLLTFLVIWAYMAYFEYMLIWMANMQVDVIWYLPRSRGGWQAVAWALGVFNLGVPFFLLLSRDVKRDPAALAKVAGLLLFMQLVYSYYQVLPSFPDTRLSQHWIDFVTPPALGGLWLAYFLWQLKRAPLLVAHDLNREAALHLRSEELEAAAAMEALPHA